MFGKEEGMRMFGKEEGMRMIRNRGFANDSKKVCEWLEKKMVRELVGRRKGYPNGPRSR